jgi:hypothetical protein
LFELVELAHVEKRCTVEPALRLVGLDLADLTLGLRQQLAEAGHNPSRVTELR